MSQQFKKWIAAANESTGLAATKINQIITLNNDSYLMAIKQYAQLVGGLLWTAFANITRADLSQASTLERPEQASPAVRHYYKVHKTLQLFVTHNIGEQKTDETRARAFQKWMDVAEELDANQCYDGFWLILIPLVIAINEQIKEQLPSSYKAKLNEYVALTSPRQNFSALRKKLETSGGGFYPTFLWFKDLIILDSWDEVDNADHEDNLRQKTELLDTIELLLKNHQPRTSVNSSCLNVSRDVVGEGDAAQLIALIRLDLITHFMQNEHKTTGWFGGEIRVVDGISYKIPLGIAQIFDRLNSYSPNTASALDLLKELRAIVAQRQNAYHFFFNSRQTVTEKFYLQCSKSIDHLFDVPTV